MCRDQAVWVCVPLHDWSLGPSPGRSTQGHPRSCTSPLLWCGAQLEVCKEQVEWARREKRTFLRQRIEARLAALHLGSREYSAALSLISRLLSEARVARQPRA